MSSSMKTEANCWLRMFAFVVASWCRNPSRLTGAIFVLSHLVDVMKLKIFFVVWSGFIFTEHEVNVVVICLSAFALDSLF